MTITNTGNEPLVDVRVRDRTDEGLALRGLTCDFSSLGGPSSWHLVEGPVPARRQFRMHGHVAGDGGRRDPRRHGEGRRGRTVLGRDGR